ncbi:MAG: hypothetical protein VYB44_07375 [Bacteroidota bacterium]|nr:hypothetical protein [Bacteroidota bacterium]
MTNKRSLAKAISKQTRQWVHGYVIPLWTEEGEEDRFAIDCGTLYDNEDTSLEVHEVFPATICRHTGHSKGIYEGDNVKHSSGTTGHVVWSESYLRWVVKTPDNRLSEFYEFMEWELRGGNIYDDQVIHGLIDI